MLCCAGTGILSVTGAAKMPASPLRREEASEDSASDKEKSSGKSDDGNTKLILDSESGPSSAVDNDVMDWSNTLEGVDKLLSDSPAKLLVPVNKPQGHPTEGPGTVAEKPDGSPSHPAHSEGPVGLCSLAVGANMHSSKGLSVPERTVAVSHPLEGLQQQLMESSNASDSHPTEGPQ